MGLRGVWSASFSSCYVYIAGWKNPAFQLREFIGKNGGKSPLLCYIVHQIVTVLLPAFVWQLMVWKIISFQAFVCEMLFCLKSWCKRLAEHFTEHPTLRFGVHRTPLKHMHDILLMVHKSSSQPRGMCRTLVNHGINYISQLVRRISEPSTVRHGSIHPVFKNTAMGT